MVELDSSFILQGAQPGGLVKEVTLEPPGALTAGVHIIDCDSHMCEPFDTWTSRVPAKYRDQVPQVRPAGGQDFWFMGEQPLGPVGFSVIRRDNAKVLGKLTLPSYQEMHPASYDPKARAAFLDELGIWAQVCYPNSGAVNGSALLKIDDQDLRLSIVTTYNDAAAQWQKESGGRLLPQAVLPLWDSAALSDEAARAVELGLTGFTMPDRPEQWDLPNYLSDHWAPLFELCDSEGIPLDFHLASGIGGFEYAWQGYGVETTMAIGSMLFYVTNAATLANWLFSGLFDRYPNLKIVSVESGAGWIPFVLEALEYQFDEMMPNEGKHLQRRPIEYFRDHVYACYWFETSGVSRFADDIGARNLLFETDFPHPTSLYPGIHSHIEQTLGHMSEPDRRLVLQENAQQLYKVPMPA